MPSEELKMPKHLSEIKGSPREQLALKSSLIAKFGYDAWEKLVADSGRGTKL
jgi:hypothetical protein